MKLQRFEVESYMTLHENNCRYNLADTVAKSLTLKELLAYDKKDSLEDLMNLSLDYGAIKVVMMKKLLFAMVVSMPMNLF